MNERYEQLLAQAHIEFAPDSKAVTKRLAELIVRECAAKADLAEPFQSSDLILKHFGVEE